MTKKADHWKRLAPQVYEDRYGIRAIVNIAAGRKEKRYEFGTSLKEIRRWQSETKVKLERLHPQKRAGAMGRGTFNAAAKKHISTLKISSWKSRRSELRAWQAEIGPMKRSRVTPDHVKKVLKIWTDAEVPPKTILNRVRALTAMYHDLDGADAWTPADGIKLTKPRRKHPDYVPPERIIAIEQRLREQIAAGELVDGEKWRGRFMVLNACGARPVHVKLTKEKDVELERKLWRITSAKGGDPIAYPLNNEQVAAWEVFIAADAWGDWDDTEYAKVVRAAGWPDGVRPYNAKHSFGQDVIDAGVDRETLADLYGHTDTKTTKIYTGRAKLSRATAALEGRLGWGKPAAVDVGSLSEDERKAKIQKLLQELDKLNRTGS